MRCRPDLEDHRDDGRGVSSVPTGIHQYLRFNSTNVLHLRGTNRRQSGLMSMEEKMWIACVVHDIPMRMGRIAMQMLEPWR